MFAPAAMGWEEAFGFLGWETTYGTAVTTLDQWWRPVSNDLRRRDEPQPMRGASGGASDFYWTGASNSNRVHWNTRQISGTVVLEGEYDDIGMLISNAVAHPSSAGGGAPLYTHTFTLANTIATPPNSFTAQRVTGTESRRFTGCMIDRLEIAGRAGQIVSVTADIIAQDEGVQADSIGTVAATPWMEMAHAVVRMDANVTQPDAADDQKNGKDAVDWTWTINNYLRAIPTAGAYSGGLSTWNNVIRQPTYGRTRTVMLEFNADWFDTSFSGLLFKESSSNDAFRYFSLVLNSGVSIGGGTYGLTFHIDRGLVLGDYPGYGGGSDQVNQTVRVVAASGGTNLAQVVLTNGTTNAAGGAYLGSQT